MPTVEFYFLCPLDICCDGQPLPQPATPNSQSMLVYLVLHRDRPQPRERLATLFWGDRPERKARGSLARPHRARAEWRVGRWLPGLPGEGDAEAKAGAHQSLSGILGACRRLAPKPVLDRWNLYSRWSRP